MRRLFTFLSLTLLLTCAKEDSQAPNTPPAQVIKNYTLTVSAGDGGSVSTTGGNFASGTQVSITATPNNEYRFTGWSDGETSLTRTIVINNNITLAAYFESNPIYNGFYYDYYELDNPPWGGTIFITGGIIDSTNNNYFIRVEYVNQSIRQMYDRRSGWGYYESYNYNASFTDDISVEIQINPEFDFNETYALALKYAKLIGQLPTRLKKDLETMWIHKGTNLWGGGNNSILIHTGQTVEYENWNTGNIVEETIIHEAAHTSLDSYIYGTDGWNNAVAADQTFISTYAEDYPNREDVAELLPLYIGVKYFPERLDRETRSKILSCCLNRILFLDSLNLDFGIYED